MRVCWGPWGVHWAVVEEVEVDDVVSQSVTVEALAMAIRRELMVKKSSKLLFAV